MKLLTKTLVAAIVASFTVPAFAGNGNGKGEQGSSHGQPFLSLQVQIDQTKADLDLLAAEQVSQGADIATLQSTVDNLQTQLDGLQAQIDTNDDDILALQQDTGDNANAITALQDENAALQDQVDDLNSEMLTKQDVLSGASGCGTGSSLRVIYPNGSYICEYDNITAYVSRLVRFSAWRRVSRRDYQYFAHAYCPSGWIPTGGGADAMVDGYRRGIAVHDSQPWGNGWRVSASLKYSSYTNSNWVRAMVNCVRNYH